MAKDVDISKSGFAAISKPTPTGPLARKQLVRNPDGSVSLQYVDNNTGQPLDSLQGYTVVEANNYMTLDELGLNPIAEDKENEDTTAESIIKRTQRESFDGNSDNSGFASSDRSRISDSPINNFGYIDKPGWMGLASALPGAAGLAGKGLNLGINMNNTSAMNQAREMMGLPRQSFMGNVKSSILDQKGQIGDIKVSTPQGSLQYPVGFEVFDKYGRTNLTPQEALNRSRAYSTPLSLATKPEVKSSIQQFQSEFPNQKQGLLSRFGTMAENFIDNLFGNPITPDYAPIPTPRPSFADRGGSTPSGVSLPDYAPIPTSRPDNVGYTGYGPTGGGSSGGLSSQAERAAASGGGGLY